MGCNKCGKAGKLAQCAQCRKLWCWQCLRNRPTFGNYLQSVGSFSVTCDCGNEMFLFRNQLD